MLLLEIATTVDFLEECYISLHFCDKTFCAATLALPPSKCKKRFNTPSPITEVAGVDRVLNHHVL